MHPIVASTTLSHSSGSNSSLLSGNGYGSPYGNHSRKGLEDVSPTLIRKGSTQNFRLTVSDPSEYSIPGVTPGTHIPYAIARARIYHNTQQITQSHHSSTLSFGGRSGGGGSGSKEKKNGSSQWVYSYLKGTLVFGRDMRPSGLSEETMTIERIMAAATATASSQDDELPRGDYWFQLVDDEADKVVWKFKVPLNANKKFDYGFDRPFFHVFQGSSRKYGFLFDDDKEATLFLNEVSSRTATVVKPISPPAKTIKSFSRNFSIRSHKKPRKPSPPSHSLPPPNPPIVSVSSPTTTTTTTTTTSFKGRLAHFGFNQANEYRSVEI